MVKILLINPNSAGINELQQKCYPPLSLLYLATPLKDRGFNVRILDANALGLSYLDILVDIKKFSPHLVGIPLFSDIITHVHLLTKKIKTNFPELKIVLGGVHATAQPTQTLEQFKEVNFVLRGESERSIIQLCRSIQNGAKLEMVEGLSFRREGKIVHNPSAKVEENLDKIKLPNKEFLKELYEKKRYFTLFIKEIDSIITSRGCPFKCRFCYNAISPGYRVRSVDNVSEEIYKIYTRGIRNIEIADDSFTLNKDRAIKIFDYIIKERLNLSLFIKSRVDHVDEEFLRKAKKAGVYMISFGLESSVQQILDRMGKGTTVEQNAEAVEIAKRVGLKVHTGWIIGFPGETPETIRKTIKFILKIKPTAVNIRILKPYPGTEVYEEAKREGTLVGDWDPGMSEIPWIRLPWTTQRSDIERNLNHAKLKIYFRPFYIYIYSKEILTNLNFRMAKYAIQETAKSLNKG